MKRILTAFIDECGNNGFKFESAGVSNYYIISSVIVKSEHIQKLKTEFLFLNKKCFIINLIYFMKIILG